VGRAQRAALFEKIEEIRQSTVIAYVTSDRAKLSAGIAGDAISIIHEHILASEPKDPPKLDLVIYSRGGDSDVPWTLVSMFRQYCQRGSFSVLVPYRAHSAATVICLGADEIVMTRKGELGPIDATIAQGPYNPTDKGSPNRLPVSVEDVNGFFSLLDHIGCERTEEKMQGFDKLSGSVHPLALGAVYRLLEETKLVGLRLLSTRADPFSEEENHEIIKKLSSELYSHRHVINPAEAVKYLGLKHVKEAGSLGLEEPLWSLYGEYKALFDLERPFQPEEHLVANGLEENTWEDLPVACIESLRRTDVCRKSVRVKRLRNVPSSVNLQLTNLQLPDITFGNEVAQMDPTELQSLVKQTLQAMVQTVLHSAAENATKSLLKALPQKGFEHVTFNSGWRTEEG